VINAPNPSNCNRHRKNTQESILVWFLGHCYLMDDCDNQPIQADGFRTKYEP